MNYLKGTAIDFIRIKFGPSPELEKKFLNSLDPETQTIYKTILPVTRVEANVGALIFEKGATVLYSDYPHPIRRMGYEHSHYDLKGIYRVLLKIVSIPYIIQKTAQLWRTYHLQGDATVEMVPNVNQGIMKVTNYPGMPNAYVESTSGYIQGTMELAGAKKVLVQPSRQQDDVLWKVTWE